MLFVIEKNESKAKHEIYILRVWNPLGRNTSLRGQVQYVQSGEVFPLREPERILAYIHEQERLAAKKPGSSGIK
jgi:hypothetical protein